MYFGFQYFFFYVGIVWNNINNICIDSIWKTEKLLNN